MLELLNMAMTFLCERITREIKIRPQRYRRGVSEVRAQSQVVLRCTLGEEVNPRNFDYYESICNLLYVNNPKDVLSIGIDCLAKLFLVFRLQYEVYTGKWSTTQYFVPEFQGIVLKLIEENKNLIS
jgi:hypothetical protein